MPTAVDLNGRARLCEAAGLVVDGRTTSDVSMGVIWVGHPLSDADCMASSPLSASLLFAARLTAHCMVLLPSSGLAALLQLSPPSTRATDLATDLAADRRFTACCPPNAAAAIVGHLLMIAELKSSGVTAVAFGTVIDVVGVGRKNRFLMMVASGLAIGADRRWGRCHLSAMRRILRVMLIAVVTIGVRPRQIGGRLVVSSPLAVGERMAAVTVAAAEGDGAPIFGALALYKLSCTFSIIYTI
ncbi:hypothetical protein ACLOJK_008509 [Asimina triloba]